MCFYCRRPITLRQTGEPVSLADATVDHFFPKSEGGPDSWRNWVLACRACNHSKASRQPTGPEIRAWNVLATEWPHIRPIDPSLVEARRCKVCGVWINPCRLGESIRAGAATETCRPRCGRRKRLRLAPRQVAQPLAETLVSAQRSRWQRLLSHLAALLRRL